jgi:hypothetical protein
MLPDASPVADTVRVSVEGRVPRHLESCIDFEPRVTSLEEKNGNVSTVVVCDVEFAEENADHTAVQSRKVVVALALALPLACC